MVLLLAAAPLGPAVQLRSPVPWLRHCQSSFLATAIPCMPCCTTVTPKVGGAAENRRPNQGPCCRSPRIGLCRRQPSPSAPRRGPCTIRSMSSSLSKVADRVHEHEKASKRFVFLQAMSPATDGRYTAPPPALTCDKLL